MNRDVPLNHFKRCCRYLNFYSLVSFYTNKMEMGSFYDNIMMEKFRTIRQNQDFIWTSSSHGKFSFGCNNNQYYSSLMKDTSPESEPSLKEISLMMVMSWIPEGFCSLERPSLSREFEADVNISRVGAKTFIF